MNDYSFYERETILTHKSKYLLIEAQDFQFGRSIKIDVGDQGVTAIKII